MINLNEEIDLVLEESLGLEFLDEASNKSARNRRKRKKRAKRRRAKKLAAKGAKKGTEKGAEKGAEAPKPSEKAEKVSNTITKISSVLGGDPTGEDANFFIRFLGMILANPTYDYFASWFPHLPDKTSVSHAVWWCKMWLKIPRPMRLLMAGIPVWGQLVAIIETGAQAINAFAPQILMQAGVDEAEPPPAIAKPFEWMGMNPNDLMISLRQAGYHRELTDDEKAEVKGMLNTAAGLLAIRALNTRDPGALVDRYGNLLRKYFIVYRAPKEARTTESKSKETGIIEEMLLVEETAPAASTTASTASGALEKKGRATAGKEDALIDALTDEIAVLPEMARDSLEELEKAYGKYIEAHKRKLEDDNYEARFMGMKYLMLRAAGLETGEIKSEPSTLQEGKLVNMVIDLEKLKSDQLDEGYLSMFGAWIEYFLNGLFGGWTPPVAVKGSQRDVEAFARALAGEKRYIETARRYGLDHPTTYKNKAKLDNAIRGFEGDTGIKWPFK